MARRVRTMNRFGGGVPPKRRILEGGALSFFPGVAVGLRDEAAAGRSHIR